ncbi:cytidine/deoxycytidylate deaminase family protein [Thermogutta sp.]|uniref:deoxycytidylate deaminase n=1 Tax=Thermogutta sp. TaxID=1962930 RepID=UPI0032204A52
MKRPSWEATWLEVARVVAKRSTCRRRNVGAVIVDDLNRVVAVGYNGAPRGMAHCIDVGCLLDQNGSCIRTVHAEVNAIAQAGTQARGTTLYTTTAPCLHCMYLIIQSGIKRVVYSDIGPHSCELDYLKDAGVEVVQYKEEVTDEEA